MDKTVYLKKVCDYGQERVDDAVEYIFAQSDAHILLKGKKTALIKANLLMKSAPDEAVTTHPAVIGAIVKALQKRGISDIVIADSPSGAFSALRLKSIYDGCEMSGLVEEGVSLGMDVTECEIAGGRICSRFTVLKAIKNADIVIGAGKLKTHAMTGMTGAVKNFFGAVPGLKKAEMHCRFPDKNDFCEMLCELYDALCPDFSIIDGIVGMEGDGPSGGVLRRFGLIAGGCDGFYVDRVLCECIGLGSEDALTVKASIERGSAPADIKEVRVRGDSELLENPIADLAKPKSIAGEKAARVPAFMAPIMEKFTRAVSPHPVIKKSACVGCGRCAEICPQHTIELADKKARILKKDCIRCFCCHEVCPRRAIEIRKSLLFRVIK
ncbi:MAG: DUF362 domain-containing protein [Oscillospiraceae bacterium]